MTKNYYVEVELGKRWVLLDSSKRQTDAMHYIKEHAAENSRYRMRIVREVRTVIFEEKK